MSVRSDDDGLGWLERVRWRNATPNGVSPIRIAITDIDCNTPFVGKIFIVPEIPPHLSER
ncbi:MAG: hypothetical protein F6K30_08140 [Cyanothece sp. SIO2G6]|nr:hypothetical protein [Cyanothece sp. SIO2G6]